MKMGGQPPLISKNAAIPTIGPQPPLPPADPVGLEDLVAQIAIRAATQHRPPAA